MRTTCLEIARLIASAMVTAIHVGCQTPVSHESFNKNEQKAWMFCEHNCVDSISLLMNKIAL